MSNHNNKTANAFLNLIEVIKKLRSPEGCPWDQKQTQKSLIPYLLEETYEVIESIEENNVNMLKEELGDLILHILFQAEIAFEKEQFNKILIQSNGEAIEILRVDTTWAISGHDSLILKQDLLNSFFDLLVSRYF